MSAQHQPGTSRASEHPPSSLCFCPSEKQGLVRVIRMIHGPAALKLAACETPAVLSMA